VRSFEPAKAPHRGGAEDRKSSVGGLDDYTGYGVPWAPDSCRDDDEKSSVGGLDDFAGFDISWAQ